MPWGFSLTPTCFFKEFKMENEKQPSLWESLKAKTKEALAPYQMGEASNKVHQIYTQQQGQKDGK